MNCFSVFIQNGSDKVEDISKDWCKKVIMDLDNEKKVFVTDIKINHERVRLYQTCLLAGWLIRRKDLVQLVCGVFSILFPPWCYMFSGTSRKYISDLGNAMYFRTAYPSFDEIDSGRFFRLQLWLIREYSFVSRSMKRVPETLEICMAQNRPGYSQCCPALWLGGRQ